MTFSVCSITVAMLLLILIAVLIVADIAKSLQAAAKQMNCMAEGDYASDFMKKFLGRKDDFLHLLFARVRIIVFNLTGNTFAH